MPKKIHKLTSKEDYDFGLAGISSPENDYRMSWILNSAFGYKLVKWENLEVYHKRLEAPQEFTQFRYFDEEALLLYRLISNKSENGYLLEEMSNIDFLIQVVGEMDEGFMKNLVNKLKALEEISMAFLLDPAGLKSRQKLLL